ncbi:EamA family transporter [Amycolatopsis echigonensis]|uniref:EamA family transporter n=1 Tax=Amycolatopsis echigonensis TaxID=2576905 RepID=A0A8E2B5Z9_9PSEU|nr:EamA family transporter [Amycolatopsis echigonensis]MBB2500553.1 EamA family transporter [Amycolatopsis echigonensis]
MKSANSVLDAALTAVAPAIWGSTYLVTTELLPADRPLLAAAVRALPAGLVLLAATRALPQGIWWWRAVVLGLLNIGAFFCLLFVAAYHLPGGVAALMVSAQPMLVLVLSAMLLRTRISGRHLVSCALGAAGVAMLVLRPDAGVDAIGVLSGLGGAACMAAGVVLTKRWGRPEGASLLAFTGWQLTVGGLAVLPLALLVEGVPGHVSGTNLAGFAYLSLVGALLAYLIWFRGIERLPALAVSFLGFASPLAAAVLGYVVLGQGFSVLQAAGAVVIVVAVALAQPRSPRLPPAESRPASSPSLPTPSS